MRVTSKTQHAKLGATVEASKTLHAVEMDYDILMQQATGAMTPQTARSMFDLQAANSGSGGGGGGSKSHHRVESI
jgi:hypothetical protein